MIVCLSFVAGLPKIVLVKIDMSSIKEQQKNIQNKGKGLFKSWVHAISIRKGDGSLTILLKLLKAIGGVLFIILTSPVILLILFFTLVIAL